MPEIAKKTHGSAKKQQKNAKNAKTQKTIKTVADPKNRFIRTLLGGLTRRGW
jgi:hypothetical protein